MKLTDIYKNLEKKYNADIIIIQGLSTTHYAYGKKISNLVDELNLMQPVIDDKFAIKIASSKINQIEDHLKESNYQYIILELTTSTIDDEFRKDKYTVASTSIPESKGEIFDNRNASGNYPKRRRNTLEKVEAANIFEENTHKLPTEIIELNDEQKQTLRKINSWVDSNNRIAILTGRAGTGKTTLLKSVTNLLSKRKKSFQLLAPTGRASRILSKKSGQNSQTIHSEIYQFNIDKLNMKKDNDEQQQSFEEGDFSLDWGIKTSENLAQIYIIDEASMIGDREKPRGELNFGTGRLLNDLLFQTGIIDKKNTNTKILFVGDSMQLPPIKEENSVALDADYLLKKYRLDYYPEKFELTQVMRQAKNSLILSNAEILRDKISQKDYSPLKIKIDDNSVSRTTPKRSQNLGIENNDFSKRIVVSRSNAAAYGYNKSIRESRFGKNYTEDLMPDDQVIVTSNNPKYGCYNGDIYTIIEIIESETRPIKLSKSAKFRKNPEKIDLFFKTVVIRPIEFDDEKYNKKIIIIENLLNKPATFLSHEEIIASRVDWNNRIRDLNLDIEAKKRNLLEDEYINAVQIKYAYAITCHKAQGGEWENVTVYIEYLQHNDSYYRWLYTAISRSINKLSFINLQVDNTEYLGANESDEPKY